MGWKEFFRKTFRENVENAENWGDLVPIKLTIGDDIYYTVGCVSPEGWKFSPKIQHPQGVRTRIRIDYFFWADANTVGDATLGIVYYKDGDKSKDPDGNDFHGITHSMDVGCSENYWERHEFIMEYDGYNKIAWYVDGEKMGETTLELPLASFAVAVMVSNVTGNQLGILVHEVVAEYYDQWEDWVNQIYGMMQWMIPAMFIIMLVVMIVSVFRSGKKKEEERKIIVVPG